MTTSAPHLRGDPGDSYATAEDRDGPPSVLWQLTKGQLRAKLAQVEADFSADGVFHVERLALRGLLSSDTFPQSYDEYREACQKILQWVPGEQEGAE
jgi:hypothetical protein